MKNRRSRLWRWPSRIVGRVCDNRVLRILHAIHDFLPRHQAGSEIYAADLCRELATRHHVTVVCADYDPTCTHGHVRWRVHAGLPVVEIVNNWICGSFADTYRSAVIEDRLVHVLRAVQPDILHVHNLMNLSFGLPALARAQGIRVVATLHDYSIMCAAGGQRVHRSEQHVCHAIDTDRCVRCFGESPFHAQMSFGTMAALTRAPRSLRRAAVSLARRFPAAARSAGRAVNHARVRGLGRHDIENRVDAGRRAFDHVDLMVAPSRSIAAEFERLGFDPARIRVSDYGFVPVLRRARSGPPGPFRIGYAGTLVWHKGVHLLIDAVRPLPVDSYEVRIFGNPDVFPGYRAELGARARGLPVRFMGAFDRAHTAEAYAQMDVLVVPSLWLENSPLVIHEAFMAGVPVVGARIGGIADLVEHDRNGLLFDAGSADALTSALRTLIGSRERVARLAAAPSPVKSIAQDAAEWERAYAEVLGRRGGVGLAG